MNEINKYIIEQLNKEYDELIVKDILDGYSIERLTTFRINTLKCNKEEVLTILDSNNIKYRNSFIYDNGYILNDDVNKLTSLEIFKEGKIYLQSISSMIPPLFLNVNSNDTILDMAAAPGSKTSLIQALTSNLSSITAIEKDKIRCERLKYNMSLLGVKNICILNQDALKLDEFMTFDKILLDAPCSGSGTLNIYDKSMLKFSKELVKNSSELQYKLLTKAIRLCKKGGTIVYSTCSILKEENEDVINKVLNSGKVMIEKISLDNVETLPSLIDGVITVKPTNTQEGFFICKLIKK